MNGTPIDRLFSLLTTIVVALAVIITLSNKQTANLAKAIGTQWNNSLKAMEKAGS